MKCMRDVCIGGVHVVYALRANCIGERVLLKE